MEDSVPLYQRVSVHGGHSGEFCSHAEDQLEDVIQAYIQKGFAWVGITEHMPPFDERFLYEDEQAEGLDCSSIYDRFVRYNETCRKLQEKYASSISIFRAFETEGYEGAVSYAEELIQKFKPDYIVGSLHHINNMPFDGEKNEYEEAVKTAGSIEQLYCDYFDRQHELIVRLKPTVVGHFDLVRLFDPNYPVHLKIPAVWERILRNLEQIRQHNLILDFNQKAFVKGMDEPYVSRPILERALEMGISVVPGDDSHGGDSVGLNIDRGIKILSDMGFSTDWSMPAERQ